MIFKKILKILPPKHPFKELVWPILGCVSLLIVCVVTSNRKYFWMDEILTYYPATMPSFSQMISFVNDKINCGSPFYFMAVWSWAKAFGASEVSLRLFSSLGFCGALLVTWSMLRKAYGPWSATLSTLAVFLGASLVLYQNSEARMYGLLMFLCALLSKQTIDVLMDNPSFNKRVAVKQALLNGLLPLTHPLGFVYSFMHTIAAVLIDLRRSVIRPWYHLSAFAGWLLFIPFLPAFLKQRELGKPHFWIGIPSYSDLTNLYFGDFKFNSTVFILLAIIVFLFSKRKNGPHHDEALLTIGALYALIPLGIWIESQKLTPLFLPRYLIGVELGWAIFLAAVFARVLPETEDSELVRKITLSLAAVVIMVLPINNALNLPRPERPDAYLTDLYPNLPIVTDIAHPYLQFVHYASDAKRFYYVLDREIAFSHDHSGHAVNDFQALQALKSHVPGLNIVTTGEFLNKNPGFIVLSGGNYEWFRCRIKNNSRYKTQNLGPSLYLVETKIPDRNGK